MLVLLCLAGCRGPSIATYHIRLVDGIRPLRFMIEQPDRTPVTTAHTVNSMPDYAGGDYIPPGKYIIKVVDLGAEEPRDLFSGEVRIRPGNTWIDISLKDETMDAVLVDRNPSLR